MGSIVLLDLMGGVALFLWGLHMVRSGISSPRRRATPSFEHDFSKVLVCTALLQSSTATALMITSFAARGLVALVPALGHHARREHRNDPDRPGSLVRRFGSVTRPVSGRPRGI